MGFTIEQFKAWEPEQRIASLQGDIELKHVNEIAQYLLIMQKTDPEAFERYKKENPGILGAIEGCLQRLQARNPNESINPVATKLLALKQKTADTIDARNQGAPAAVPSEQAPQAKVRTDYLNRKDSDAERVLKRALDAQARAKLVDSVHSMLLFQYDLNNLQDPHAYDLQLRNITEYCFNDDTKLTYGQVIGFTDTEGKKAFLKEIGIRPNAGADFGADQIQAAHIFIGSLNKVKPILVQYLEARGVVQPGDSEDKRKEIIDSFPIAGVLNLASDGLSTSRDWADQMSSAMAGTTPEQIMPLLQVFRLDGKDAVKATADSALLVQGVWDKARESLQKIRSGDRTLLIIADKLLGSEGANLRPAEGASKEEQEAYVEDMMIALKHAESSSISLDQEGTAKFMPWSIEEIAQEEKRIDPLAADAIIRGRAALRLERRTTVVQNMCKWIRSEQGTKAIYEGLMTMSGGNEDPAARQKIQDSIKENKMTLRDVAQVYSLHEVQHGGKMLLGLKGVELLERWDKDMAAAYKLEIVGSLVNIATDAATTAMTDGDILAAIKKRIPNLDDATEREVLNIVLGMRDKAKGKFEDALRIFNAGAAKYKWTLIGAGAVGTTAATGLAWRAIRNYQAGLQNTQAAIKLRAGNEAVPKLIPSWVTLEGWKQRFQNFLSRAGARFETQQMNKILEIEQKFPTLRINGAEAKLKLHGFLERAQQLEQQLTQLRQLGTQERAAAMSKFMKESVHPFMRDFNAFTDSIPEARKAVASTLLGGVELTDDQWKVLQAAHLEKNIEKKAGMLVRAFGGKNWKLLMQLGIAGEAPALETVGDVVSARGVNTLLDSLDLTADARRALQEIGLCERLSDAAKASPDFAKTLALELSNASDPAAALRTLNGVADALDDPVQVAQLLRTQSQMSHVAKSLEAPILASRVGRVARVLNTLGVAGDIFAIWMACEDMKQTDALIAQQGISEGLKREYGDRYYYHAAELGVAGTGLAAAGLGAAGVISGAVATPVLVATLPISLALGAAYQGQKWQEDKARTAEDWAREHDAPDLIMDMQEYGFGERVGHTWDIHTRDGRWLEQLNPLGQMLSTARYLDRSRELARESAAVNRKMIEGLVLRTTNVQIPETVRGADGVSRPLTEQEADLYKRTAKVFFDAKVDYIVQNGGGNAIYGLDSSVNITALLQTADDYAQHVQMTYFLGQSGEPLPEGISAEGSMKEKADQFARHNTRSVSRSLVRQSIVGVGLSEGRNLPIMREQLEQQISARLAERSMPAMIDFEVRARNANYEDWWSDGDALEVVRRHLLQQYSATVGKASQQISGTLLEYAARSIQGSADPGIMESVEQQLAQTESQINAIFAGDPRVVWENLSEPERQEVRRREAEVKKVHESFRSIYGESYKNTVQTQHVYAELPRLPEEHNTVYIRSGGDTGGQTVYYMYNSIGKKTWLWSLDLEEWSTLSQIRNGRAFHRPLLNTANREFNNRMLKRD